MIIKDLKKVIKDLPDDMDVILQKDPEGNGYYHLRCSDSDCIYEDGEVYDINWSAEDCCLEEEEWDELKTHHKCLILAP